MQYFLVDVLVCGLLAFTNSVSAQSASTTGYVGYNLTLEGDDDSVIYSTDDTRPDAASNEPDPDVVSSGWHKPMQVGRTLTLTSISMPPFMLAPSIWRWTT